MTASLLAAAEAICVDGRGPWIALPQHQVHSRIADLVMARIDPEALEARLGGDWLRSLNASELQAMRSLRRDRGTSLGTLAERMRAPEERVRRIVSRLVAQAYVDKTASGSYARLAPVRPIVDRIVSFEAKLYDAHGAYLQARAHGHFAHCSYVACDAACASRFKRRRASYRAEGIGLLALSAADDSFEQLWPAGRNRLWHVLGQALSAERTFARLLGISPTALPETRLPNGRAWSDRQVRPQLVGRLPKTTLRRLPGLESSVLGR